MAQTITQTTIPTLYNMSSSQSFVILWALEEAAQTHQIKYNLHNLPRRDPNTLKTLKSIFPIDKSPIVTLESTTNAPPQIYQSAPNVLTESRLILQFISDNYTTGEWTPKTPDEKNRDAYFQEIAKSSLLLKVDFALIFETIAAFLPWGFRHLMQLLIKPLIAHFVQDQRDILQVMENALSYEMPWFSGREIGLADFNMSFPMDITVQRGYFEKGKFPRVAEWHDRMVGRAAYKRALEKGGKYDLLNWA